ncbi:Aldo/keto reductase [Dentipellis sp. KUC8613]|nr:Aldo/keto reductase [Dentipellis sp. KUC8613]
MVEEAVEVRLPAFTLNDGTHMPAIGLGCWMGAPGGGERVNAMVGKAIRLGYRHFDTASGYANEEQLGDALYHAGIPRSQLYITTKLGNQDHHRVSRAFDESLRRLKMDYVDMYLMHWPQAVDDDAASNASSSGNVLQPDQHPTIIDTWREMEKLVKSGRAKSIGVSNFSIKLLQQLLAQAEIVPATNQVEMHPCLPQNELKAFCESKDILLTAYSPLGRPLPKAQRGDLPVLLDHPTVREIAKNNQAAPGQVLVSWGVQRQTVVIPKSEDVSRLKANITLVKLSGADMQALDAIHRSPGMHRSLLTYHGLDPGRVFGWTYEQMGWDYKPGGKIA